MSRAPVVPAPVRLSSADPPAISRPLLNAADVSAWDGETVAALVEIGRAALVRFYSELGEQMDRGHGPLLDLVAEGSSLAFLRQLPRTADALHPPVTDDTQHVPRVEVRGSNAAVVWVGIPSAIAERYHHVPKHMLLRVDGKPTGRMCAPPAAQSPHPPRSPVPV